MNTITINTENWLETTEALAESFAKRAAESDAKGEFVYENYELLMANEYFSLLVPEELGGAGMHYAELCKLVKTVGKSCGSTALALSMQSSIKRR